MRDRSVRVQNTKRQPPFLEIIKKHAGLSDGTVVGTIKFVVATALRLMKMLVKKYDDCDCFIFNKRQDKYNKRLLTFQQSSSSTIF